MFINKYQAKYYAHDITRLLPSDSVAKFAASLQDAQVDLNPHQVEAALFAFHSPLSKGAIIADEVGLGKTIEAGIILSQQWAERKRHLLIITPANLRKQWNQELLEKFNLPSLILESKSFNEEIAKGNLNPFEQNKHIIICSYQFAKSKAVYLQRIKWDLVIIDEAHRLRNVYKPTNQIGNTLKNALAPFKKVLLTATPLQNSILELYGLVSIIDEYTFGDLKSFKSQFSRLVEEEAYDELKRRIAPICHRTLRRQVMEYINYTNRISICEEFFPTREEDELYNNVSEYLQRPKLYALPNSQRQLMTLILRKLLASSSYAIYGTLDSLVKRLELILKKEEEPDLIEVIDEDYEAADEMAEEWSDETSEEELEEPLYSPQDIENIKAELEELKKFRELAYVIKKNSKAEHLFIALEKGFKELEGLGANKKAIIFTESRRTQDFLYNILQEKGYRDKVVLFNGVNNDPHSRAIYQNWLKVHKGTDKVTGSKTADMRSALVDFFKNEATIMIATEAAAEGINLQFCSLVVNYDLPWNPQRIEQRIGRCHRYGQKHDVVVVNFLNKKNQADIRVYELLSEKFKLFDGVFGASDEVLGAIGSGVDFEKRIAEIYQNCRKPEEIQAAFDALQEELKPQISEKIQKARTTLLENFDEEVREKLKSNFLETRQSLSKFEEKLWLLTQFMLQDKAVFNQDYSFTLKENPYPELHIHEGPYLILKTNERGKKSETEVPDNTNIYRVGHPLAQRIIQEAQNVATPPAVLTFHYAEAQTKISYLEQFIGKTGWLRLSKLSIDSFEQEDHLLAAAFAEDGTVLDEEMALRLLALPAKLEGEIEVPDAVVEQLAERQFQLKQQIMEDNSEKNSQFFDEEMDKLEHWAEDMKLSLEKEIKDLDAEIKLKKAEAKKIFRLEEKVKMQRLIKDLEKKRSEKRRSLYEAQDEIDRRKDALLEEIEARLQQKIQENELFTIQWKLV